MVRCVEVFQNNIWMISVTWIYTLLEEFLWLIWTNMNIWISPDNWEFDDFHREYDLNMTFFLLCFLKHNRKNSVFLYVTTGNLSRINWIKYNIDKEAVIASRLCLDSYNCFFILFYQKEVLCLCLYGNVKLLNIRNLWILKLIRIQKLRRLRKWHQERFLL